jgi:hypothetical protein
MTARCSWPALAGARGFSFTQMFHRPPPRTKNSGYLRPASRKARSVGSHHHKAAARWLGAVLKHGDRRALHEHPFIKQKKTLWCSGPHCTTHGEPPGVINKVSGSYHKKTARCSAFCRPCSYPRSSASLILWVWVLFWRCAFVLQIFMPPNPRWPRPRPSPSQCQGPREVQANNQLKTAKKSQTPNQLPTATRSGGMGPQEVNRGPRGCF